MNEIVRDPGDPHGGIASPAARDGKVPDVHQRPEEKPVHARKDSPHKRRFVHAKEHGQHDQHRPDVEI